MKERILTSLIAAIVLTGLQAQTASPVPRLVVGLTIDQLRSDYIEAFSALYGEKGLGGCIAMRNTILSIWTALRRWHLFIPELHLIIMVS